MSELAFFAYAACCVLAAAAPLTFALREWRSVTQREPMFVDQLYVRVERYFGIAFREKLERWLWLRSQRMAGDVVVIRKEREEIWVHQTLTMPAGASAEMLIVADTLETAYGCRLLREVYARQDCRIGAANVVQAIASDGPARIGSGTHVARWVDAAGDLVVERDSSISGRVTSTTRIVLHAGARVRSAHAPLILTMNGSGHPQPAPDIGLPETWTVLDENEQAWVAVGASRRRRKISGDCIVYEGDLILPTVVIPSSIVVHGDMVVGPHSVLNGDVKATGSLRIGTQSICRGNLVAERDVELSSNVAFAGVIYAEGTVRLLSGVSGNKPAPGVAVYGAHDVILEPDVAIQGKVSSGSAVIVVGR